MIYSNISRLKAIFDFQVNGIKIFVVLILLVFFFSSGNYFYIRKIRKN